MSSAESEATKSSVPLPVDARDYHMVMTHFYRGELGRIMTWRQRLDTTTNWAIIASTGIVTFALGYPGEPDLLFMLANVLCLVLLIIEGRRYRYYDAFRARVRMLESHFILPVMLFQQPILQGNWREVMAEDLLTPSFKISRLDAVTRRFRRNYVYMFTVIATAWLLSPRLHTGAEWSWPRLWISDDIAHNVFVGAVILFYSQLLFLLVRSFLIGMPSGEFTGNPMRRKHWPV